MRKKNVGVIGNGKWAKILLPKIAKYANIKFIANTKTGYKKFKLDNISWIFVLTNNETHYEIVKYFLKKNKNVFCEKPLTNDSLSTEKLFNLSKKQKVKLFVNNVELFKKKKIFINKNNTILRTKKSNSTKESLLYRLAYHDFYLLEKYIDIDNIRIKTSRENKKTLTIELFSNKKKFNFFYDINSIDKKHKINKTNMMQYKVDPLEKMIRYFLFNESNSFDLNESHSIFAIKLISKIKKNLNL
tara:strand:- start:2246 stop:2977 length:732 start_codon:yes stop_codon:yes gene_type:complete